MSSIYNDDSLTLHTDLYQINMMKRIGKQAFLRKKPFSKRISGKLPFENGYAILQD